MNTPTLIPIKNGWAAIGRGWAVHGADKNDALKRYFEAENRHKEIDARPFLYEMIEAENFLGGEKHSK